MQISEKDIETLKRMQNNSPDYYDLFMRMQKTNLDYASSMAHDIRNSATVLHGTLQVIEHKFPGIASDKMWENFSSALYSLIDYLNTTSELRYAASLNFEEFDILDILWNIPSNLDDLFESIHQEHTRSYRLELPDELPSVYGDYDRINAALLAITRNCVEATSDGDVIRISSHIEGGDLIIIISDDGQGIADDMTDRLFTPFCGDKPGHAGVGLATAKLVALGHGGDIYVTPLEHGTEVNFKIPMHARAQLK